MESMPMKTINVSNKRQITIPKQYFDEFGFGTEAECISTENGILIRPKKNNEYDFSEEILKDLLSQGYKSDALLQKFHEVKNNVRPAIEKMIKEADNIAEAEDGYCTTKDVFS